MHPNDCTNVAILIHDIEIKYSTSVLIHIRLIVCKFMQKIYCNYHEPLELSSYEASSCLFRQQKKKILSSNSTVWCWTWIRLKGKFSSGIEGALAPTLNHDFNWKQLSEMILCIFLWMFSKFIWVHWFRNSRNINKKRLWILGVGVTFYLSYLFQDA